MAVLVRSAIGVLAACATLVSERLPFRAYTTAQGLPSNSINRIVRDSRGFLWFCTGEGLSRLDGFEFVNFAASPAPGGRVVWDLVETARGEYWAATGGGLARVSADGRRLEGAGLPGVALALKQADDGGLWVGTQAGLYRWQAGRATRIDTGPLPEPWSEPAITALESDAAGDLWFGSYAGIGRVRANGLVDRWTPRHGFASYVVNCLFRDLDGSIWAGTEKGLCHLRANPRPGENPAAWCYGPRDGLPSPYIQAVLRSGSGHLWAATIAGAAYSRSTASQPAFAAVTARHGLSDDDVSALASDAAGNLWLGTGADGAMSLSTERIVVFSEADGLTGPDVVAVFEDPNGQLYAVTRSVGDLALHRLNGTRFVAVHPKLPAGIRGFGRGLQQVALRDRAKQWWIATGDGVLRYRSGDLSGPGEVDNPPEAPDRPNIFRLYEDSAGNVWWSASSRISNVLARWERATGAVCYFGERDGLPSLQSNLPTAFVEDKAGTLWFGFESTGVARRMKDGRFEYIGPKQGGPEGRIRGSCRDRAGRLWFASSTGLWRVDEPSAPHPRFTRYTGLSSPTVHSLTEDAHGRIYAATSLGLDVLDPESGRVEPFPAPEGLPGGLVQAAFRDRSGALWFATRHGVARYIPKTAPPAARANTLITGIRVRGVDRTVSIAGESEMHLSLRPEENQVEFAFVSPRFRSGADVLYQYRLEGAGNGEWSVPARSRSVNFASLAPGAYRFAVRSVDAPASVATVDFRIAPPVWATWWFRLAVMLCIGGLGYGLYRYRMRAALEREQLRLRLATDLHDDIGASLSSIAIWSDVAVQQAHRSESPLVRPLEQIGAVSREVIDSVSDMVWAINPHHDRFEELGSRLRRYVEELASAANRPITFRIEGDDRQAALGPAVRRELFLVLKEALNNALRHSGFTECVVTLAIAGAEVTLRVTDNGRGFDTGADAPGNGIESMRRRAARLGGRLTIESGPGSGAAVTLAVPTRAHLFRWRARRPFSATLESRDHGRPR